MPRDAFFACYLLTPVAAPQRLRSTYVGFTVSPTRRIRQHNGELVNGAKRTKKYRPWEMIVVVHGFPSKFHALQFEYAWQHPYNCRFTKERLRALQGSKGLGHPRSVKRKLVELHEMLHVAPWQAFPLTVSYTNLTVQNLVRTTAFYQWPTHMTCEVRPLHEFTKFQGAATATDTAASSAAVDGDGTEDSASGIPDACYICDEALATSELQVLTCYHDDCRVQCHSLCLADHFLLEASMASESNQPELLRPERGACPDCLGELLWPLLVRSAQKTWTASHSKQKKKTKKRRRPSGADSSTSTPPTSNRSSAVVTAASQVEAGNAVNEEDEDFADADDVGDCNDSGWFENDDDDDEVSRYEYVDRFDDASESAGSGDESSCIRHPVSSVGAAQAKPEGAVVVDLTLDDDD